MVIERGSVVDERRNGLMGIKGNDSTYGYGE